VLSVIHLDAVDFERGGAAAEEATAFEELDVFTGLLEIECRGEAGEAAANDRYALDSHERTTT
jgi:hypothetical protein